MKELLTQSRKDAKSRKVEADRFLWIFADFDATPPLRETCWSESQIPL